MSQVEKNDFQHIAVLGAGPMGLAVAYQLVKDGYHPVIYEADNHIGGMAASFDFGGVQIERFYHFHCTSDSALLEVLRELGIEKKMHWVETKMSYYYQGKVHSWGNPIALLLFPGLSWIAKFRYGLHVFLSTRRNEWHSLDKIDSVSWLKRWVGDEAYEILWHKLFELKFYNYASNISAAWTWSRLRRVGRSRYNLFREKLGYLEGGSETVLNEMKSYIEEHGGKFRLGCPVQRVIVENLQIKGVETSEGIEPYEKVISTIPLPYIPHILSTLPDSILESYRAIDNIAIVCVIAKLRRSVTKSFWLNINDPNMDIPGIIEYTNLNPLDAHIVYVPYYMPGEHQKFQQPNQVFIDKVKNYLQRINPELRDEDFIAMYTHRYRYAQPVCTPGFLERLPPTNLPVKGLWVADTSYYYPEDRGISESFSFGRQIAKQAVTDS